jgi:hypothetical protein
MTHRLRPLLALALSAALLSGCGLGAGEERAGAGAQVVVTRDFGHRQLGSLSEDAVREDQTVMRLLRSKFDVTTRYGGRFVQSIDGLSGKGAAGQRDWFFWVNGIESDLGAAEYTLSPGDHVQWDYRDWRATMRVPAIVGAFPEPLEHGWKGKRRPVRVECEQADSNACEHVRRQLTDAGVPVSGASLGAPYTEKIVRVIVGRWKALRQSVSQLERGPQESGVFVRFAEDGGSLDLLDPSGASARTVRPGDGTGLVAALFPQPDQLTWVVTGLDDGGVEAAAGALDVGALRDAFAVAATPAGSEKLPLEAR